MKFRTSSDDLLFCIRLGNPSLVSVSLEEYRRRNLNESLVLKNVFTFFKMVPQGNGLS